MVDYKAITNIILDELRLKTRPVAIKLLKDGLDELAGKVLKPSRDLRRKLTLCQMIALSRYYGWILGGELEDMACPGTMIIFGMIKPPSFVKEGALSYGLYTETREAAVKLDTSMPVLREGVKAIATAPLDNTPFEPDVIVVYGTPGQILKLIAGYIYKAGEPVRSESYAKAGSDLAIVASILDGKPRMFLPGLGDRIVGRVEDNEVGFVAPADILEDIVEGMREQSKTGFIVYPPQPILIYSVHFELIPVIGQYYAKILEDVEKLAKPEKS